MEEFSIKFITDRYYFIEAYEEASSIKKLKKYEPFFSVIMIATGFVFYLNGSFGEHNIFPLIFISLGFFEFLKAISDKKRWLYARMKSDLRDKRLEMFFGEKGFRYTNTQSETNISWGDVASILSTNKGIIIKPVKGFMIYLPKKHFTDHQQIDFILSKNRSSKLPF